MATNRFPNKGYVTLGRDYNFFEKVSVTATTFGGTSVSGQKPDLIITFPTQSVIFLNEGTGATSVIEYSFNGTTVHGELDPSLPSKGFTFDNRVISVIWFRLKAGSTGPVTVRVDAWGTR